MPFATVDSETGLVVGSTRFLAIEPRNRRLEIGYAWIAGPWQRSHVNTEGRLLVLRHASRIAVACVSSSRPTRSMSSDAVPSLASAPWRPDLSKEHDQPGRAPGHSTYFSGGSGRMCWIAWREPGDPAVRFGISPRGQQSKCAVFPISRKAISVYYSLLAASCAYRKRMMMGQFTRMPVEPKSAPSGPVSQPCRTNSSSWNSSIRRDRYPLSMASWVHSPRLRSHNGL